ncbi:VWA domain-containing protein [archaeon]|nr:VWA domain-containing protein [archaeon]
MEIEFTNSYVLLLLLVIPILVVLHYYFFEHNKKKAMRFANFAAMKRVTGTHLITKNTAQLILRVLTIIFLIIAISGPIVWYDSEVSLTNYVIAIDSSASMVSQDILPNRLEVAKLSANNFLQTLESSTKIGVVSFSGVSFVKSPLTDDLRKVTDAISSIEIELIGGTDIGAALITSVNMLNVDDSSKSIILITDGSDTSGTFVEDSVQTALSYVINNHVKVNTISIGTGKGGAGYIDEINLPAVIDKEGLGIIATRTGGKFYEIKSIQDLNQALSDIDSESEEGKVSFNTSYILFAIGLFLLLFEWTLLNTRFRSLP